MKLNLFLVPASANVTSRKAIVKRILSTVFTTLALTGAAFLFKSTSHKFSLAPTATVDAETDSQDLLPRGLSRKRGAFNKAIEMIADAAAINPRLANYYKRVTKRVKGHSSKGENSSGVRVVKSDRMSDPGVSDGTTLEANATADVRSPVVREGLVALAQSVANLAKSVANPNTTQSDTTATYDSPEQSEDRTDARQRFTVGDMVFDTNPAIEHWTNYYSATPVGRRTMKIGIERSNSYLEMARAEFRRAGVPEDLVWLAFVESVWNPRAVSPAAAGGIWQFIPATATDYGLTVESGNDERADPFKQTRVAATYLHDLYTVFGDWALAMAAYNSGEPRVMGAIVKNGRANFWDLYEKELLPKETREYVPKILAAIKVASQAETYGLVPQTETGVATGS